MEQKTSSSLEIAFGNGGDIRRRDFRLDIDGIPDEALADCIVRDLRLLMVGSVKVSNRKIISEPHKRLAS